MTVFYYVLLGSIELARSLNQTFFCCCTLSCLNQTERKVPREILTVEWQRKPNMIMVRAGVRMVPNTMLASPALISAMMKFCAVTSTEHAQQSREPLNSRGASVTSLPPGEYGGGTTTPDPALEGEHRSEWACSDTVFSSVPFRDRLIFRMVSAAGKKNSNLIESNV